MPAYPGNIVRPLFLVAALLVSGTAGAFASSSWSGLLRDGSGKPISQATVRLRSKSGDRGYEATTSANGTFTFAGIAEPITNFQ